MSVLLEVEMPEGAFSALKQDHEGLTRELRLAEQQQNGMKWG